MYFVKADQRIQKKERFVSFINLYFEFKIIFLKKKKKKEFASKGRNSQITPLPKGVNRNTVMSKIDSVTIGKERDFLRTF